MRGKIKETFRLAGGEWLITLSTREDPGRLIDTLKDSEISIDLKKYNPKRSKDANSMCWALCAAIGKAMRPIPLSKEEVYRLAIKAVGVFTDVNVRLWDVDTISQRWAKHGTGWFLEVLDDAGPGRKKVSLYYGTSTYTVDEMRAVLDWLVDQAEQLEIAIPLSKAEEERLLEQWGKA